MNAVAHVCTLLHARSAAAVAALASQHRGSVTLEAADGRRVDAASVLAILSLATGGTQDLVVRATGADRASVVAAVAAALRDG